jgi:uncharacterized membrane protein
MQQTLTKERILAGLSYLSVLVFIPLLLGGTATDYGRHHLRQGLLLFIIGVILSLTAWMWLPLWGLANLALVIASIYGCVQAVQGNKWTMPVLGSYASKIKL